MSTQTHYETLGLAHNAPLPVIKAAYKALALVYHPDKTVCQNPSQRAEHATVFRAVQEAYDVLSSPSLKAFYDAELQKQTLTTDTQHLKFHNASSFGSQRSRSNSYHRPSVTVYATTPEEKTALKLSMQAQFDQIKQSRAERSQEDALLDITGLRYTLKCWRDLAEEQTHDPIMAAHCKLQALEYEKKLRSRETEHEDWLKRMSKPKTFPHYQDNRANTSTNTPRHSSAKIEKYKQAEDMKAAEYVDRARARAAERIRLDNIRKSQLEAKAAAVRVEKEMQQKKKNEAAAKEAARIAKVRAKVLPATKATSAATAVSAGQASYSSPPNKTDNVLVGTEYLTTTEYETRRLNKENQGSNSHATEIHTAQSGSVSIKSTLIPNNKTCGRCGEGHASLTEWKRCNIIAAESQTRDGSFFAIV
jgi:curved DNA-binding protein CbpA